MKKDKLRGVAVMHSYWRAFKVGIEQDEQHAIA